MNPPFSDESIRALVRDTIRRMESRPNNAGAVSQAPALMHLTPHPSQYQYTLPPSDGPCLIESGVPCNHCGYCQTHGH
jgi:hypothetical protein